MRPCPNKGHPGYGRCLDADSCWEPCGKYGKIIAPEITRLETLVKTMRYTVFGVSQDDHDTLIENRADDLHNAVMLWHTMCACDYTARIWDNELKGFVTQRVIDLILKGDV